MALEWLAVPHTLRVQTGCEERCAYCIIPTTRGAGRSRAIDEVLAEIHRVCASGYREIPLTGVHLGSYGRDLQPRQTLLDLLTAIERRAPSDVLFRISSLEPMDCTRDVVDLVAGSARFAPHLHLPLQHASDRMLWAMGRPYTLEYYRALVDDVHERLPHASIGSDVIVGFPGERDEDVDVLLAYLAHSPLTHLHVFPYSDRPGTRAESLPDKVPGSAIRERAGLVREVGRSLTTRFHLAQMGSVRRGLTIGDGSMVVTDNYLKVGIPPGRARNEWVSVRLTLVVKRSGARVSVTAIAASLHASRRSPTLDDELTVRAGCRGRSSCGRTRAGGGGREPRKLVDAVIRGRRNGMPGAR